MNDQIEFYREQILEAKNQQQPLSIVGGGTKSFLGRSVSTSAKTLATKDLTGVVEYEPVELIMTAKAGTSLGEIDAVLEQNQQMLACDPARFNGNATIGGSLAANQSGPARPWAGSLRDHVLGVNLINGEGEFLRFGGRVMKNVAGFDVSRLQCGAMGTLGLMTEISFKVMPKPEMTTTLTQQVSAQQAIEAVSQLARQSKPISGASWVDGVLYLRLAGAESAVSTTAKIWGGETLASAEAEQFWIQLREQQLPFFELKPEEQLWRFSVNSAASTALDDQSWLLDWGGSLRWLKGNYSANEMQSIANEMKGAVSCYRSSTDSKPDIDDMPESLKLIQRRLKNAFDPHNIFNPSRLYSWL